MIFTIIGEYLPWLLSAITIWMTLLAGNKHPKAWLIGLGNQLLWLVWIVSTSAWGLLPMNICLWDRLREKPSEVERFLTEAEVVAACAQFGPLDPKMVNRAMGFEFMPDAVR